MTDPVADSQAKQGDDSCRVPVYTWTGSLLLGAAVIYWYSIVIRADGANWLESRLAVIRACGSPSLWLLAFALLAGWLSGIIMPLRSGSHVMKIAAMGASAGLVAVLAYSFRTGPLTLAPDWYPVTLAVLTGTCLGTAYGCPRSIDKNKPLWPLLIVPLVVIGVSASTTGTWGYIVAVAALVTLGDALGRQLASWTGDPDRASAFVRGALGVSTIILVFRLVGALGGAGPLASAATLLTLAILCRRHFAAGGRALSSWLSAERTYGLHEWALVGTGIALATVYWMSVLSPETGSDAIGGRSAVPLIWSHHGSLSGIPEIFLSYMGIGGEVLNLSIVSLAGGNVAKVTTFACALWLAGALLGAGPKGRSHVLPLLSCLAFFFASAVAWLFAQGFADIQSTLLIVASFGAFEIWVQDRKPAWLFFAGVIGGSAVAVKLNAATVLVVIGVMVLCERMVEKRRVSAAVVAAAIFAGGVLLSLGPGTLRSYLLTGNPVFPFAHKVFPSALLEERWLPDLKGGDISLKSLTLPFRTVLNPSQFNECGTYHPAHWILALAALAMVPWSWHATRRWWILSVVFWIGWLATEQNIRYSIPALACTSMAISASSTPFKRGTGGLSWTATCLLLLGSILNLARPTAWMWANVGGPAMPRTMITGRMPASRFLDTYLPSAALGALVNKDYGPSAVIWQVPCYRDHQSFLGRVIS